MDLGVLWFWLIVVFLLLFKLWWDTMNKRKRGRVINHSLSAAIDGVLYVAAGWFFFGWSAGGWIVMAIAIRWIGFDLLYNLVNEKKWSFCSNSAKLDQWGDKLDGEDDDDCAVLMLLKIVIMIIGVLIVITEYNV